MNQTAPPPKMGPHDLLDSDVDGVIDILEAWPGPRLSWALLIEAIAVQTGKRYTIEALQGTPRIQLAYAIKIAAIQGPWPHADPDSQLAAARDRIIRQERTIARLMMDNMRLAKLLYSKAGEHPQHLPF
ncbi:hypothetical protein OOT46_24970 [Aquabacterium sp. A7-Y]|uniref:hypothetical protein n=1 Tax=Aquabacterium sp. A7-Y TaxID=1349605 RepID=UPI00223E1ED2|nr:hypothetical protein [Aquabacterium sp. A7-Y]MCW7541073.1 hypothetical protein [Aquabacterium sp. A7-Y]